MGQMGVGKSQFINRAAERNVAKVGHGLELKTTEPQSFLCARGTGSVYLVDTPGFDDTYDEHDIITLNKIIDWRFPSSIASSSFCGILYLVGPIQRNLPMLQDLKKIHSVDQRLLVVMTKEEKKRKNLAVDCFFSDNPASAWDAINALLKIGQSNRSEDISVQSFLKDLGKLAQAKSSSKGFSWRRLIAAVDSELVPEIPPSPPRDAISPYSDLELIPEIRSPSPLQDSISLRSLPDDLEIRGPSSLRHSISPHSLPDDLELIPEIPPSPLRHSIGLPFHDLRPSQKLQNAQPRQLDNGSEVDGLILLLGQTGAGKSTFINDAVGKEVAKVGHDFESSTPNVSQFVAVQSTSNPHPIMLVDTPGFNDTWLKDADILAQIIAWLKVQRIRNPINVYGIIYLHDLAGYSPTYGAGLLLPTNLSQPSLSSLANNMCLVTVGWTGKGIPKHLESRENDLKAKSWSLMAKAGLQIHRFEHTHESAWNIIEGMRKTTMIPLETFIGELEVVQNDLSQDTPRSPGHRSVLGFFLSLFGQKK